MRISELKELILEDVQDVSDLCALLEISAEDILDAFERKIPENIHKFILPAVEEGVLHDGEDGEDTYET